jgi:hypothetical protein
MTLIFSVIRVLHLPYSSLSKKTEPEELPLPAPR